MVRRSPQLGLASFAALLFPLAAFAQDDQPPPAAPDQPGITVEARGPIHEAFAEPSTQGPEPGIIVPKQPPDPIPEQPPDVKPEGDNVEWIPGYWAWDAEKSDFLWVSGFWRNVPPGRRWVPGYWTQVDTGWQWVSGFWADANQQDLTYLPEPPAPLDTGPDTPPPNDSSMYVPGCWVYANSTYVWRPGYWINALLNWLWTPSHYCWTPSGYVYVNGYWDYPLANRGTLFCPVSFSQPLWTNPGWAYTPQYTVSTPALLSCLWVQPAYRHYFFGNYYGNAYRRMGLQPWLGFGPRHHDPLFNYYNWAGGKGWYDHMRNLFVGRQDGTLVRPARTWAAQQRFLRNANITDIHNRQALALVHRFGAGSTHLPLARLNQSALTAQRQHAVSITRLQSDRARAERPGAQPRGAGTVHQFRLPATSTAHRSAAGGAHPGAAPHARPPAGVAPHQAVRTPAHPGGAPPAHHPTTIAPHAPAIHPQHPPAHPGAAPHPATPPHVGRPTGAAPHLPAAAPHVNHPVPAHPAAHPQPHPTAAHPATRPAPHPAPHPVARPAPHPVAHPQPHPAPHHR